MVFPCRTVRDEWPTTSVFGILGSTNTRIFRSAPLGTYPQGRRLFLGAILSRLLHFLKPLLCRVRAFGTANSLARWFNTVVFLPTALCRGTRTRFSSQGALYLFSHGRVKPVMQGLKPFTVRWCHYIASVNAKPNNLHKIKTLTPADERLLARIQQSQS